MPITGSCHCGRLAFRIEGEIPAALTRCTCTFCAKRGALLAYYPPQQFSVTQDAGDAVYRWHTKLVAHHFRRDCGVATWSDSPDFGRDGSWDGHTRRIGVNARLFDGWDAERAKVEVIDGRHLW
ncbi:MAG: GFA family protein [Aquabacterium sp.]|nr:MAG: GFA family protein [Aquabacterium sp.]